MGPAAGIPNDYHISEATVLNPSDMIAIGDAYDEPFHQQYGLTLMWGYQFGDDAAKQRARLSTRKRHTGVFNVVFCDGHVEHFKPSKLFGLDDRAMRRWNNDNQPHYNKVQPEIYPPVFD